MILASFSIGCAVFSLALLLFVFLLKPNPTLANQLPNEDTTTNNLQMNKKVNLFLKLKYNNFINLIKNFNIKTKVIFNS